MSKWAVLGALAGVVGTYPAAAVCALVYHFPVPLGGNASGLAGAALSTFAVTFYGIVLGGFVVQGAAGAIAATLATRRTEGDPGRARRIALAAGAGASIPGVILLATLEKIIGPW